MRTAGKLLLPLLLLLMSGCNLFEQKTDWSVSLGRSDKKPYGAYLAYRSLNSFFPSAYIEALPGSFKYINLTHDMLTNDNGSSLMILEGLQFRVTGDEWAVLEQFAQNGNELMIFCNELDPKIARALKIRLYFNGLEEYPDMHFDTLNKNIVTLADGNNTSYTYQGRSLLGQIKTESYADAPASESDDEATDQRTILGKVNVQKNFDIDQSPEILSYVNGVPDCLRFRIGNGHIIIHSAPLALSNYFLLQNNNISYISGLLDKLPNDINRVYWNDYYKRTGKHASLGLLLNYPATRAALWLIIFLVIVFLIFEIKRRQRIVPVLAPLKNESVAFVETVGRLYFNKGDHRNLAEKMTQQFLEWVRNTYFINTNMLNEQFEAALALKSGVNAPEIKELISMIHEIRLNSVTLDDAYLYRLYTIIQQFYTRFENKKR